MTPLSRRIPRGLVALVATSVLLVAAGCGRGGGAPAATPQPSATSTVTTTPTAPAATLSGTLLYLGVGSHGGLYALHGAAVTTLVADSSFAFYQSAVVSPDGHKVAFVLAEEAGSTGPLRVVTIGGGATTMGPTTISNVEVPQWTPDGSGVYVSYDSPGRDGRVDVSTGAITPVPSASGCCFVLRSPDGAHAIVGHSGVAFLANPDGSGPVAMVAPPGTKWSGSRLQSLSPDGRHVTALLQRTGEPAGDAGRRVAANAIVDATTGTIVPVPGGGTLLQAWYLADGRLIERVDSGSGAVIRLVSADFTVLDQLTEPAGAASLVLIGYVP